MSKVIITCGASTLMEAFVSQLMQISIDEEQVEIGKIQECNDAYKIIELEDCVEVCNVNDNIYDIANSIKHRSSSETDKKLETHTYRDYIEDIMKKDIADKFLAILYKCIRIDEFSTKRSKRSKLVENRKKCNMILNNFNRHSNFNGYRCKARCNCRK